MSKKHFIKAAEIIRLESNRDKAKAMAALIVSIADNPNFDRARFYRACGLE